MRVGCLLSALIVLSHANASVDVIGVPKDLQSAYKADGKGKWRCLNDSSIEIDFSRVNNGVCDCPDGSDEPSTGACGELTEFYCQNEGFIPRYISGSKVGDGICDCCDCSDEVNTPQTSYRGRTCQELKKQYEDILQQERLNYEQGLKALSQKFEIKKIDSKEKQLKNIEDLDKQLSKTKDKLQKSKARYEKEKQFYVEKVKLNDPIAFELQKIDMNQLTADLNSTFATVIQAASAFQDITKILDDLSIGYTRSLNDKVVNENVKKYDAMINSKEFDRATISSKVETELHEQLLDYFVKEIPRLVYDKKSDETNPEYVIRKAGFVKALVSGKTSYSNEIVNKGVRKFIKIMDTVASNYNVNFQDRKVIEAAAAYHDFLGKYENLLNGNTKFTVPDKLIENIDTIIKIVETHAKDILSGNLHIEGGESGPSESSLEELNQLRKQLKSHEKQLHSLEEKVKGLELEKQQSVLARENATLLAFQNILEQLNAHKSGCVSSKVNEYSYEICIERDLNGELTGMLTQRSLNDPMRVVRIGSFTGFNTLNEHESQAKHQSHLSAKYPDLDVRHLRNERLKMVNGSIEDEFEYLYGDELDNMDLPIVLGFTRGEKCWNGPSRAAEVSLRCAPEFNIEAVTEPTKCYYNIVLAGPLGCVPRT